MLAAVLSAIGLFAQAFAGTWTCHSEGAQVPWVISPAPGGAWTSVRWGDQKSASGGIAWVGYVEPNRQWIYEDFHYDGSYAANVSQGPRAGVWTWSGAYFAGERTLHGDVLWKRTSAKRIDRTFELITNGKAKVTGKDYCTSAVP